MDKNEIIIVTAILLFAALRIYQKFFRKDKDATGKFKTGGEGSLSKQDSDYEPYLKKK